MTDHHKNAPRPRKRIRVEELHAEELKPTSVPEPPDQDADGGRSRNKPKKRQPRRKPLGDYDVGYGKPPKQHRFKPGQSGNTKGRPKGQRNALTLIREILQRPVKITRDGKQMVVPSYLVAYEQLMQKAMRGDPKAMTELHKLARDLGIIAPEPEETEETPQALSDGDLRAYASLQVDLMRAEGLDDAAITKALTAQGLGSFVSEFLYSSEGEPDEE